MILIVFDIYLILVALFIYYYYQYKFVLTFATEKNLKSILVMYTKVVYIWQNVSKNSAGIVKKMSFCDKMTKKSVGGDATTLNL